MTGASQRNRWNGRLRIAIAAPMAIAAAYTASLAVAAASPTAATLHPAETCGPSSGQTLAADAEARVYSVPVPTPLPLAEQVSAIEPRAVKVFGCLFATERSALLGSTLFVAKGSPTIDPHTVALASPWVAYSLTGHSTDFNSVVLALRNLKTGKVTRRSNAGPGPLGPEQFSKVTAIGVNAAGAFAWISIGSAIGGPQNAREVGAVDSTGAVRTLDTAENIDPRSLVLHGHRLSWTDGGVPHSAVLG
jgi:hypothetical protein